MSIATRIQAMSNHIRADYIAIRRLGVDLEGIEKNIENIASVVDTAYANLPKVTGEGSSLSLTPTRKGGLSIIPKGACEQDSYSGKNKLPNINPTTQTKRDVTATLLNDGTLQLNGTNTGTSSGQPSDFYFVGDDNNYESLNVSAGNYYFSGTTTGSSDTYLLVLIRRRNGANTTFLVTREEKVVDIQDGDTFRIMARVTYQTSVTNLIMKPMLSATANDTFEKYVGGIPSPNPDYPQDIRVVTGDNSVIVQSKNLFDYSKLTPTSPSTTYTYTDENVTVTYKGAYTGLNNYIPITNQKYTISIEDIEKVDGKGQLEIRRLKNGVIVGNPIAGTTMPFSVVVDNTNGDYDTLRVSCGNGNLSGTNTLTYKKIQVEVGDTKTNYKKGVTQSTTLHLGTNYLAGIPNTDYGDEIVGKTDEWKIKRKVRKLDLAIADMNNIENYPGWKDLPYIVNDLNLTQNTVLNNTTSFKCNITTNKIIYVNQDRRMWLVKDSFGYTQTQWKTNYPNLVFELYYGITNEQAQYEETITDTTLITDLNNMYQAMGYDGITNIIITSNPNNAQMTASVIALKGE